MIAIRKFIGSCIENITTKSNNLEAIVGSMGNINSAMELVEARERDAEIFFRKI